LRVEIVALIVLVFVFLSFVRADPPGCGTL
jgi:hypothetical protein